VLFRSVVPEYDDFNEVVRIRNGGYEVSIEALNGIFYKGYNEIRVKITSGQTQEIPTIQAVTFLPILTEDDGNKTSGPHLHDLVRSEEHTSELQSRENLVCRLLLEKKKNQ